MHDVFSLHETPHRHYKVVRDGALRAGWNGAGGRRIASVTQILGGDDSLPAWAARQAMAACTEAVRTWYAIDPVAGLLSLGEIAQLQPEWPDNVKDKAAAEGTAAHTYFGACLLGPMAMRRCEAPYGLRCAIDAFITVHTAILQSDARGPLLERAVGDFDRAVAGTYDAVVDIDFRRHRIDLKSSKSMRPEYWAQLAAYERCAMLCGEMPSEFLSILHIDRLGGYALHSIPTDGPEHVQALALFDAHLLIHRSAGPLAKLFNVKE